MNEPIRFRDILNVYGEQLLSEATFARIIATYLKTGFIHVSADRTADGELGRLATPQESEEQNNQNDVNREKLRSIIQSAGYGFVLLEGGYREKVVDDNGKETYIEVDGELSFLIPTVRVGSYEQIPNYDEALKRLGQSLAIQFNQDTFLYKPSNEHDTNAYLLKKDGSIEAFYKSVTVDKMKKVFHSYLKSKSKNRLSLSDGFVKIPRSPRSATEARERYGKLFWNFR